MESILPRALALPEAALLALVVGAAGLATARALLRDAREEELRALALPVGMALLAVVTSAMLFGRIPPRWPLAALLAAAGCGFRCDVAVLARGAWRWIRALGTGSPPSRLLAGLALVYGGLGIVGCLAPETGWDTGLYHFTMARLRAEEGWMAVRDDIPAGYRPGYVESLQAVGFLFQGETLASLVNLLFYFSGLGVLRIWAGAVGGERAGLIAGFAYLTSTTYVLRTGGGDVEVGQAVFLGVAFYALWRLRGGGSAGWGWAAGAALGMLLGIKYPSAWIVLALALVWIAVRIKDRASWKTLLGEGAAIGLACLAVGFPWYLRNHLALGNAVYPFLQGGGGEIAGPRERPGPEWIATFATTMAPDAFCLAGVPALAAGATRGVRWVAAVAGLFYALLLFHRGFTQDGIQMAGRYSSPSFMGLWLLAALGLAGVGGGAPWARRAGFVFLGIAVAATLSVHAARNLPKAPAALGWESRAAYLERRVHPYWAIRRAERDLPPGRKILLVDPRAYYCRAPYLVASDSNFNLSFESIRTPAQLREFLGRHSIGFVVYAHPAPYHVRGFSAMLERSPGILEEAGAIRIDAREHSVLYRVP